MIIIRNFIQFLQCFSASFIQGFKQHVAENRNVFQEKKPGAFQNEGVTQEVDVEIVDSREISNKVSTKIVPTSMLDLIQSGQTDIAEQPTKTSKMKPSQTEVVASSKCDNVGRFAHPGNCEKYYFCFNKNEDQKLLNCPHHQAFDPITRTCVHDFAVCAVAPKCTPDQRALPNVNDKSTYFECKFRHLSKKIVLRKRSCAEGREFDAELGYCKSKFLDSDFPSDSSNSAENMECEQVGIFTDYSNDFGYYECMVKSVSKGTLKLIRHSCPAYHIFIKNEKQCVPFTMKK